MTGALAFFILGLLGLLAVLYWLLDRHEARQQAAGKPRRGGLAVFFAAFGLLLMLFAGGCGALFLANADGQYVNWQVVAIFTLPAIAVGLMIWFAARARWNKAG